MEKKDIPVDSYFDAIYFFRILREDWRILIGIISASMMLALVFAFLMEPIYKAEVLVAPVSAPDSAGGLSALAGQFGGIASIAGLDLGKNDEGNRSFAVLNSRYFTEMFIRENNLMPILFSDKWDNESAQWIPQNDEIPTMADAFEKFDRKVRFVSRDNSTGFVTLTMEWTDPLLAAEWANALIATLNSHLKSKDIAETKESIRFLIEELEKSSIAELRVGISRVIGRQIEAAALANVRHEYAYKILDPAFAADADKPERPKKVLMLLTSFVLGFIISAIIIMVRARRSSR